MFRKSLAALALGLLATGVATAGDIKDDPDFKALQNDVKGLQSDLREVVGLLKSQASKTTAENGAITPVGFSTGAAVMPALIGQGPALPADVATFLNKRLQKQREEEAAKKEEREIGNLLKEIISKASDCGSCGKCESKCSSAPKATSYYYSPCEPAPKLGCWNWR